MPNKYNTPRRHHIPKMKFRVKNWAEYDAGLRRRGSLTLWLTPEVLDGWQAVRRTTALLHGSNEGRGFPFPGCLTRRFSDGGQSRGGQHGAFD